MTIEILTPVGRLVSGHPMESYAVIDDKTKQPKLRADGTSRQETFAALAVQKGQEQHWNQTEWGAKIWNAGAEGWPNGEFNSPTFAWKIEDGDSQIPNKKGRKNCDREGYPGHWIIKGNTGFSVPCYNKDNYEPHQVIQRKEAIKRGDYARLFITCKGNAPSQSPGVYVNLSMFELYQAGIEIIGEGAPDPKASFAAAPAALPTGALVDNSVQAPLVPAAPPVPEAPAAPPVPEAPAAPAAPAAAAVHPAPDFLNGPPAAAAATKYLLNGAAYTKEQLVAVGWTDAQIIALPSAP